MKPNEKISIFAFVLLLSGQWSAAQPRDLIRILSDATLMTPILNGSEMVTDLNRACKDSLTSLKNSLDRREEWALKMLDAAGKITPNVDPVNAVFEGSYRECSRTKVKGNDYGKFCKATIRFEQALENNTRWQTQNYTIDVCVPSGCTEDELNRVLVKGLVSYGLENLALTCYVEKRNLDKQQIAAIVVLLILITIVILGTAVDFAWLFREKRKTAYDPGQREPTKKNTFVAFLTSFSLYTNAKTVLKTHSGGNDLTALNGIRFLSTTWIILYHDFYQINFIMSNSTEFSDNRFRLTFQCVLNGLISVDSFFLLGGLLVAYVNIRKLKKNSEFTVSSYVYLVVHRYWRLTPPIILTILLVFIWPCFSTGPNWTKATLPDYEGCSQHWFANILYINNFFGLELPCMDHLWYLANDMQFYLIAPVIFCLLYKHTRKGVFLNSFLLFSSIVISFVLGVVYDLQATTLFFTKSDTMFQGYKSVYTKPYTRIGPYCLGIFVGYLLATRNRVTLKPSVQVLGWFVSFVCCFSTLYGVYNWNQGHYGNRYVNALYLGFHRSVWALGVAWICYACATGYGGIVNTILSWKAFVPLGKLTYVAYLIHPFVLKSLVGFQSNHIVMNNFLWVVIYVGVVGVTFGLSFPLTLCFELPFLCLEKIIFRQPGNKRIGEETESREPISIISPPNYNSLSGRDNEAFSIDNNQDSAGLEEARRN